MYYKTELWTWQINIWQTYHLIKCDLAELLNIETYYT